MKLLFDENLSPKLVAMLVDVFPSSAHVHRVGLGSASDDAIWKHAREHGYTLVSKDSDFQEMSLLYGWPPKVVWLKRGNCSTQHIEIILRSRVAQIEALLNDPQTAVLLLL